MKTDKTTSGDFRILLFIIAFAVLIWGFFKYKNKIIPTSSANTPAELTK